MWRAALVPLRGLAGCLGGVEQVHCRACCSGILRRVRHRAQQSAPRSQAERSRPRCWGREMEMGSEDREGRANGNGSCWTCAMTCVVHDAVPSSTVRHARRLLRGSRGRVRGSQARDEQEPGALSGARLVRLARWGARFTFCLVPLLASADGALWSTGGVPTRNATSVTSANDGGPRRRAQGWPFLDESSPDGDRGTSDGRIPQFLPTE